MKAQITFITSLWAVGGGGDSVVDNAIHYRLDSPGIENRPGPDFLHLSIPALNSPTFWFPWVQMSGRGVDQSPQ
jgi:hypothetical protein